MSSKLIFSSDELETLHETEFFERKAAITSKVYDFYGWLVQKVKQIHKQHYFSFPEGIDLINGKISKGEHYKGLPYFILDFPRLFSQQNICSFRAMLWWGHYWSVHLHLKGDVMRQYGYKVIQHISSCYAEKYWLTCSGNEWNYDFSDSGMKRLHYLPDAAIKTLLEEVEFLKISTFRPITTRLPRIWMVKRYMELMQPFIAR